jgi:hypothetical protein
MKKFKEDRALIIITILSFTINLLSLFGILLEPNSFLQLMLFRLGDTMSLLGSITAGLYVGSKGQNVASSGFIMLGIVHGISAGASGFSSINIEATAILIIPLTPAFLLMLRCTIFPNWLRWYGLLTVIPFSAVFYRVACGMEFFHWTLALAYILLAVLEIIWAGYLWIDLKKNK